MRTAARYAVIACVITLANPVHAAVFFQFGPEDQKAAIKTGRQACIESRDPVGLSPGSKRKYCTCVVNYIVNSFSTDVLELALTMSLLTKERVKEDKNFQRLSAKFGRRCLQAS